MRLKGLDLNLLVALNILLEERSVSRAAERLHLSQPAASAALGRLRSYFNDELLVLHGKRMIPTSYAQSLAPEVRRILGQVDAMISMSAGFEPERSERVFRLMASDYISTVLVIPVAAQLAQVAPGIKLDIRLPDDAIQTEFERGEIDLSFLPEQFLAPGHPAECVFEEPHVVVGWNNNPVFEGTLSEKEFFAAPHVAVRIGPARERTFTERRLKALGVERKVDLEVPNFSMVPWGLLGTRRLAVMQRRLAEAFQSFMPLTLAPLPFEFPPMRLMVQYHNARATDLGLKWLMEQFLAGAASIGPDQIAALAAAGRAPKI